MTLYELIKELEKHDLNKQVRVGFGKPHSYRGNHEDLAFEPIENTTVGEMLAAAKSALDETFYGYKGGEYVMNGYAECWLAEYGRCGETIGAILLQYMLGDVEAAAKKIILNKKLLMISVYAKSGRQPIANVPLGHLIEDEKQLNDKAAMSEILWKWAQRGHNMRWDWEVVEEE